jgi:hypothetical protein
VSSAGQEAVELAASAGLLLDDWQADVLHVGLGEQADGRWAARECGLIVPRQNGKGSILEALELFWLFLSDESLILHSAHEFKDLDVSTPILTANRGWSTMGELVDGDEVYAPDGQVTKVLTAHPVLSDSDCFRVSFADGQSFVAGSGHLWAVTEVARSGKMSERVVTTAEIASSDLVHNWPRAGRDRNVYRWRLPIPDPIVGSDVDLPIDPYLLGMWLGDGDKRGGRITTGSGDLPFLLAHLDRIGRTYSVAEDKRTDGRVFTVRVAGLTTELRLAGLRGDKHIPDVYMAAPIAERAELLAGLLDSDGTVSNHQVSVTMIRESLMVEVLSLVRSLGYRATIREFRARLNGADAGPMWRVQFSAGSSDPFRLPRKNGAIKRSRLNRSRWNAVVKVERVPTRKTRCITVTHESGCFLVGRGFTVTHNTAAEGYLRVKGLIEATPDLDRKVNRYWNSHGQEGIELVDGRRLRFVARTGGSGRGFTGDKIIWDEAYNLSERSVSATAPTMATKPYAQLWYTSSAPLPDVSSDVLRRLCKRGREGADGLAYFEWSAVDPSADDAVASANPSYPYRISVEAVALERALMTTEDFERERLGIWSEADTAPPVIPADLWFACGDVGSELEGVPAFALEVSSDRSWACVAAAGRSSLGELVHGEIVTYHPGTEWCVTRMVELFDRWGSGVTVAKGSPAASLVPALEAAGVPVVEVSTPEHARACGQFYDSVVNGTFRHRNEPAFDMAVRYAARRDYGDTWVWSAKRSSVDVSPLVAVTLAARHVSTVPEIDLVSEIW